MTENSSVYSAADEQEINLISLLFYVLRRYRIILAGAVLCLAAAVAFALFSSWQTQQTIAQAEANGESVPRTEAQQQYEEDMVTYREAKATHDTNVQDYRDQLLANERSQTTTQYNIENAEEYIEKSVRNSIDPYNVYTARADYYVTTDYKILPGMDYQNPNYTNTVLSAYVSLMTNSEAITAVAEQFDMEERYLRELVSVSSDDATRLVRINVTADTAERASAILDAMQERLNALYETINSTIGNHTITLLARSSTQTVSTSLRDEQQSTRDNLTALQNQLQTLKDQHDLLEQNIETADKDFAALEVPEEPTTGVSVKKYAAIGCVVGIMLTAGWAAVQFLVQGKVCSARDLQDNCRLPILGVLAGEKTQKAKGLDARLDRWESRPRADANDETTRLIAATIQTRAAQARTVLVTGDLPLEQLQALADGLQATEYLRDVRVTAAESILCAAATVPQAAGADAIVLAADCTCSHYRDVDSQNERLQRLGKSVLGCVVYE